MHHSTDRHPQVARRSVRAALDPYFVDETTFTRSEILQARANAEAVPTR